MALFLITGPPGTGKSTLCAALRARGELAYGDDEDGLGCWRDRDTHEPIERVPERSPEFLGRSSRDMPREGIAALAEEACHGRAFVCGSAENEDELMDLFTGVFTLVLVDSLIAERLAARTHSWGKSPHQVAWTIAFRRQCDEWAERFGHTRLDASLPTDELVEAILAEASRMAPGLRAP
jgi:hypothetical protein